MRALVINLAAETARMAFMAGQLDCLGIGFERIEAVTPATLSPGPEDPWWRLWERPLRRTEMAAFASHRSAWARVAEGTAPRLILEDDAILLPGVPALLARVAALPEVELLTLETRGRRKRIAAAPHPGAPIHRLWQDRSGAAAYVLSPSGARKLLARAARAPGLADAVLCAAYEVAAWQAVPALACQIDRCATEGIAPPIPTESAIDREDRPRARATPAQKARRIAAQLRMGWRGIAKSRGSENLIVPLADDR